MTGQKEITRIEEWEPLRSRILRLAERLEECPDVVAVMTPILDVADEVSEGAEPVVLAGMIALILSPYDGETNGEYAARLREQVTE